MKLANATPPTMGSRHATMGSVGTWPRKMAEKMAEKNGSDACRAQPTPYTNTTPVKTGERTSHTKRACLKTVYISSQSRMVPQAWWAKAPTKEPCF